MSAQEKVRLGIAGCGATRVMFGVILRLVENGVLVAAMDPEVQRAEEMRKKYGARQVFADYDEFLDKADIDAVIIGSPVYLHAEQVVKAAEAGKHILCEKPMARTIGECDLMLEACRKHGVKLMVGLMKRFDKSMQYAAELIRNGTLGEVVQIISDWSCYSSGRRQGWRVALET
ncbi:MAG TPA: Gfo/Idh/MocA family oxidoreductase [Candidatus Latescibacteria bacterium]|nr:Gfo/Idh/MocA family oxidoreductase [Candidatus Latescibacterota bacterium]